MSSSITTTTVEPARLVATPNDTVPSGPLTTEIIFFKDAEDGAAPFNYVGTPPEGQKQNNFGSDKRSVEVKDIRNNEGAFTLDSAGFATISSVPSSLTYDDWDNEETIQSQYYLEVESFLLSNVPGAQRVLLFDHTIRRTKAGASRGPVTRAHIDQTAKSATQRVYYHLPDEADTLAKGRVRIINVWRPLWGPVEQYPLAMADSRSVAKDDLIPVEHRYPDRTGETAGVRHNEAQQWYYWSGMKENERVLLQCFDSHGNSARVAHTAIIDRRIGEEKGRESIEVRALVFG